MPTNCVNCGHPVSTHFCPNCGQRNGVNRISFKHLYDDLQTKLFGFDLRFLRTSRYLFTDPGHLVYAYLGGNRVRYTPPFSYFILLISVWLLLYPVLGVSMEEMMQSAYETGFGASTSEPMTDDQRNIATLVMNTISSNMRIFSSLFLPIMAIYSVLFFPKLRFNFLESVVVFLYIYGFSHIIVMLEVVLYAAFDMQQNLIFNLLTYVYLIYAYYKISRPSRLIPGTLRIILMYVLAYITYIIMIGFFSAIFAAIKLNT